MLTEYSDSMFCHTNIPLRSFHITDSILYTPHDLQLRHSLSTTPRHFTSSQIYGKSREANSVDPTKPADSLTNVFEIVDDVLSPSASPRFIERGGKKKKKKLFECGERPTGSFC